MTEEQKQKRREYAREWTRKKKESMTPEELEKYREYHREYDRKRNAKRKEMRECYTRRKAESLTASEKPVEATEPKSGVMGAIALLESLGYTVTKNRTAKQGVLVIVDMQNDFVDGALANPRAKAIVGPLAKYVRDTKYDKVILTRDYHTADTYLRTREGKKLPVPHCIKDTRGSEICMEIMEAVSDSYDGSEVDTYYKKGFGTDVWFELAKGHQFPRIDIVGTCAEICVATNAILMRTAFPEAEISVLEDLCAGRSEEAEKAAYSVLEACHVDVGKSE